MKLRSIIIGFALMLALLIVTQVSTPQARAYTRTVLSWTQPGTGFSPERDLTPFATPSSYVGIAYACTGNSADFARIQEVNTQNGVVVATYRFLCDGKTHIQLLTAPLLVYALWYVQERARDTLRFSVAVHGGIVV